MIIITLVNFYNICRIAYYHMISFTCIKADLPRNLSIEELSLPLIRFISAFKH